MRPVTGGDAAGDRDGPTRRGPNRGVTADTSPEAIEDQLRAAEAVALRRQGKTLAEVSDELGYYDTRTASRAIKRHLAKYKREDAEAWRDLLIDRWEYMYRTLIPAFEHGGKDGNVSTFAADRMATALQNIAALTGADKLPPLPDPDVEQEQASEGAVVSPGVGRTLADLLGSDPAKARLVARALGEVLPARGEQVVIEASDGSDQQ